MAEIERRNIPLTGEHFAAFCEANVGKSPYWYGTCYQKCTKDLLDRKRNQYPSNYSAETYAKDLLDITAGRTCADCIGAFKGYMWRVNSMSKSSLPDRSANGMFSYAKELGRDWGVIDTMPELIGLAVRYDGHVGYYVGNGWVVEWRGWRYGCVKTRLCDRKWTHWYKLPKISYSSLPVETAKPEAPVLGSRLLRRGLIGEDVRELQSYLIQLGYNLGEMGADGDFGTKTENAVKAFQNAHKLKADGIYGENTHAALMGELSDPEEGADDIPTEPQGFIEVTAAVSANVRSGPGTQYGIVTCVAKGRKFPLISSDANGWHCIDIGGKVAWISPKMSEKCA